MIRIRVIPILLLHNLGLVKTVKFKKPKYVGDPINAVKIFNDKFVDELVILDITATSERRKPNYEFIKRIVGEAFMPVCYGGAISTIEEMHSILKIGVEKIAINTSALIDMSIVSRASKVFGSQSLVVSIDVKKNWWGKYEVVTHRGTKGTGLNPVSYAKEVEKAGAGEILINSVDKDGSMTGYDLELIENISAAVSIPIIACGGAARIGDFHKAWKAGASAVAAGSMFVFHGPHRAVLITFPSENELETIFYNGLELEGK